MTIVKATAVQFHPMLGLVCLALGGLALPNGLAQAQQTSEVQVNQILSTVITSTGQPIVLPQNDPQLNASIYLVAPHAVLPEHKHPFPRYGYVLAGHLQVTDTGTGKARDYKPGDFILESVGQWHTGANTGSEPVKLLVIDIVEKGQANTVLRK